MQFEGRRRLSHVPNLTPLIDIVFLLLVFFMLTSHFVREENIKVDLPVAQSGAPDDSEYVQVVLDAQGRILVRDHFIDISELESRLSSELQQQGEKVVRIRGDRAATLGLAVGVLDAARKAGAEGVDIVTVEQ
ncbi:ExbD/TolR family protein [Sulfurivermis fontis]|jgi:biopolymer transport protein ExbD|uniref:ExbD/TolR family protein n=1 Tax=Sulfurivermis fontis TaxID=1972068 RepID=UPI000FD89627|nr:biopolymer transporter ExbD [Sulfurivermis fontis]